MAVSVRRVPILTGIRALPRWPYCTFSICTRSAPEVAHLMCMVNDVRSTFTRSSVNRAITTGLEKLRKTLEETWKSLLNFRIINLAFNK
jgi:hypothetical protein